MKKSLNKLFSLLFIFVACSTLMFACKKDEPVLHSVIFVYDNGTENYIIQVEDGKKMTEPTLPTKEGYNFDGWYLEDFKWGFEIVPVTDDLTLTAKWSPKAIDVTFEYNNNTGNRITAYYYGGKITEPRDPVREGYTFDGWFVGDTDTKWNFDNVITSNITLSAHWTEVPKIYYTVTFMLDNEIYLTKNVQKGEKIDNIVNPTKENYNFDGWFYGEYKWNFDYNTVTQELVLTAKFSPISLPYYTVTFKLDDGTTYITDRVRQGDKLPCIDFKPTKELFDFSGWLNGEDVWNFDEDVVNAEMTLVPYWTHHNFNITYETYGGTHSNQLTYNRGQGVIELVDAQKDGYKFEGWYIDTTYQKESKITHLTTKICEDTTIYACFSRTFTQDYVTYDEYGVNVIAKSIDESFDDEVLTLVENCTEIGDNFFADKRMTDIVLPSTVTKIGEYAFCNTVYVTIYGGQNVTYIGKGAFKNASSISFGNNTENYEGRGIYWPANITVINEDMFTEIAIDFLVLPSTVTEVKTSEDSFIRVLYNNTNINLDEYARCVIHSDEIKDNDIIYKVGDNFKIAVKSINGFIDELIFAEDCTGIIEQGFKDLEDLSVVYLTANITEIGENAFANCPNFKTLYNFTNLEITKESATYAFASNLENIYNSEFVTSGGIKYLCYDNKKIAFEYVDTSVLDVVIADDCTELRVDLFINSEIISVVLGANLKEISNGAFSNCKNLKAVVFNEGLETIDMNAFYNCISLTSIQLPSTVQTLKTQAFVGCSSLKTAKLNSGLKKIEQCAFQGCGLTSIVIPDSVTSMANMVFRYCPLESVTLGTGLTCIDVQTFRSCTALTSIIIPSNILEIKDKAFYECSNLKTVINYSSSLNIVAGSEDNGYVAYYADTVEIKY